MTNPTYRETCTACGLTAELRAYNPVIAQTEFARRGWKLGILVSDHGRENMPIAFCPQETPKTYELHPTAASTTKIEWVA